MRFHSSLSRHVLLAAWRLLTPAGLLFAAPPIGAQATAPAARVPQPAAADSTSPRCMNVAWLDPSVVCEGRLLNAGSLATIGAGAGALAGFVGGAVLPTDCLGGAERTAVRGAIAGAAIGSLGGLLVRHVSRRELAARHARAREAARRNPPRPWSWRDVRPLALALGGVAATGGVVGAVQAGRSPTRCATGPGGGAAQGAAVYAAGGVATVSGSMLIVRILF